VLLHYLKEAIEESNMDIMSTAKTPATQTLFDVDDPATPLGKNDAEIWICTETNARSLLLQSTGKFATVMPCFLHKQQPFKDVPIDTACHIS
jgi:hypothetical protein